MSPDGTIPGSGPEPPEAFVSAGVMPPNMQAREPNSNPTIARTPGEEK